MHTYIHLYIYAYTYMYICIYIRHMQALSATIQTPPPTSTSKVMHNSSPFSQCSWRHSEGGWGGGRGVRPKSARARIPLGVTRSHIGTGSGGWGGERSGGDCAKRSGVASPLKQVTSPYSQTASERILVHNRKGARDKREGEGGYVRPKSAVVVGARQRVQYWRETPVADFFRLRAASAAVKYIHVYVYIC